MQGTSSAKRLCLLSIQQIAFSIMRKLLPKNTRAVKFSTLLLIAAASQICATNAQNVSPKIVETCGQRFVELNAQSTDPLAWLDYGEEFDKAWDIPAYSNGAGVPAACYQCTEVVHRLIRYLYGVPSYFCSSQPLGDARYVARNLQEILGDRIGSTERLGNLKVRMVQFFNGSSSCRPMVGSVVSLETSSKFEACNLETGTSGSCDDYSSARAYDSNNGAGHVAIIRSIQETTDGILEAELFAQHGALYSKNDKYVNSTIKAGRIRFRRTANNEWFGWWWTPDSEGGLRTRPRPVIAWANAEVVETDATPSDWVDLPIQTPCLDVPTNATFSAGCEQIKNMRAD